MNKLLIEKEVAEFLSVSQRSVQNWRHRGTGPRYLKIGGRVRYDIRDIERFLEKYRQQPSKKREGKND